MTQTTDNSKRLLERAVELSFPTESCVLCRLPKDAVRDRTCLEVITKALLALDWKFIRSAIIVIPTLTNAGTSDADVLEASGYKIAWETEMQKWFHMLFSSKVRLVIAVGDEEVFKLLVPEKTFQDNPLMHYVVITKTWIEDVLEVVNVLSDAPAEPVKDSESC